jgi:hypothetical protein
MHLSKTKASALVQFVVLLLAATALLLSASPAAAGSSGHTRRLLQEEGGVLEETNDADIVQVAAAAARDEVVELGPGVAVDLPEGFAKYLYKSSIRMGPVLVRVMHDKVGYCIKVP